MALEIRVPRLGWTMESGTFGGWLKKDGEAVEEGIPLFTLESDKALQEVEAMGCGILRIPPDAPASGATVDVGVLLGYLVEPGEAAPWEVGGSKAVAAALRPAEGKAEEPRAEAEEASLGAEAAPGAGLGLGIAAPAPASGGVAFIAPAISPRALRIARELGVDWARFRGSGRGGRIVERDIRDAARSAGATATPASVVSIGASTPAPKQVSGRTTTPLSAIRRTIADRMHAGTSEAAPVTLTTEADATELVGLREKLKSSTHPTPVPTITDLFVLLSARALIAHPALNARFEGGEIVLEDSVHLALAVDTPDGLLAPVIRDADKKTIAEIALETRSLIEKARSRKTPPEEMQGGTFTLTNLGMYGVDAFTPILNLPQCAVLGVGRIVLRPAVHEGQLAPRQRVSLSLTFDHRVVDGGPAARFLSTVREYVERPDLWFAGSRD